MISLWFNVCSINSWWIYLLIAWISCHMHHIDIYLDNGQILTKNQNFLGIGHQNLWISTKNGKGRITKWENVQKKLKSQNVDCIDQVVDRTRTGRLVRQDLGFLRDSHTLVSALFSSISLRFLYFLLIETYLSTFWTDWRLWIGFLGRLKAKVSNLDRFLFLLRSTISFSTVLSPFSYA